MEIFSIFSTLQTQVEPNFVSLHQAEKQKSPRTLDEEQLRKEILFLQEQLVSSKDAAAAEISGLQEVQVSLQGQLQRCKSHIVELTNKLRETEMVRT